LANKSFFFILFDLVVAAAALLIALQSLAGNLAGGSGGVGLVVLLRVPSNSGPVSLGSVTRSGAGFQDPVEVIASGAFGETDHLLDNLLLRHVGNLANGAGQNRRLSLRSDDGLMNDGLDGRLRSDGLRAANLGGMGVASLPALLAVAVGDGLDGSAVSLGLTKRVGLLGGVVTAGRTELGLAEVLDAPEAVLLVL
jgi:hypothetical protein